MCNVVMSKRMKNLDFVLYNIIFEHENTKFTVESLLSRVKSYFPEISKEVLQRKVDNLVLEGLIRQRLIGEYHII